MCQFSHTPVARVRQVTENKPIVAWKVLKKSNHQTFKIFKSPYRGDRWVDGRLDTFVPVLPDAEGGIYAFQTKEKAVEYQRVYFGFDQAFIVVEIELWGTVVEHKYRRSLHRFGRKIKGIFITLPRWEQVNEMVTSGYRAEHARIVA